MQCFFCLRKIVQCFFCLRSDNIQSSHKILCLGRSPKEEMGPSRLDLHSRQKRNNGFGRLETRFTIQSEKGIRDSPGIFCNCCFVTSHIVLKDSDSSTTILASYNRYWLVLSRPFRRESCSCVSSTIVPE